MFLLPHIMRLKKDDVYRFNVIRKDANIEEASKDPIIQGLTITQVSPTTVNPLFTGKVMPAVQFLESIKNSSNNNGNSKLTCRTQLSISNSSSKVDIT